MLSDIVIYVRIQLKIFCILSPMYSNFKVQMHFYKDFYIRNSIILLYYIKMNFREICF